MIHSMKVRIRLLMILLLAGVIPACNGTLNGTGSGGSAGGGGGGGTPPGFSGLAAATAGGAAGQIVLSWSPAVDFSGGGITYLVYPSNAGAGKEDLSAPQYTTTNGTGLVINGLVSGLQYWFIVDARDGNGNFDGNMVERTAVVP